MRSFDELLHAVIAVERDSRRRQQASRENAALGAPMTQREMDSIRRIQVDYESAVQEREMAEKAARVAAEKAEKARVLAREAPTFAWDKEAVDRFMQKHKAADREWKKAQQAAKAAAQRAKYAEKKLSAAEQTACLLLCSEQAETMTQDAQQAIAEIEGLLAASLIVSHVPDLDALTSKQPLELEAPKLDELPKAPEALPIPPQPQPSAIPTEPHPEDAKYRCRFLWTPRIRAEAQEWFESDHRRWTKTVEALRAEDAAKLASWKAEAEAIEGKSSHRRTEWERAVENIRVANEERQREHSRAVSEWRAKQEAIGKAFSELQKEYDTGNPDAVRAYVSIALFQAKYPPFFPEEVHAHFNPDNGMLLVDRDLPTPDKLPSTKEVVYVKTRDEFDDKPLPKAAQSKLYDDLIYMAALRTVHEALAADTHEYVVSVVFNGWVNAIDPATGHRSRNCIASLHTTRDAFSTIELAHVDPKACFKRLKGVAAPNLLELVAVRPLARFSRDDDRFTEGRDIADGIDSSTNLAAMDWEDFEHLIRELFESEFGQGQSEVRITRASRDRGVDAIAFDPDPIRGGKFVIQAKRYTRTVGVEAVRDLYGTVMNEGANRGILVTTADYGPDAYEFAKDKPLTLLNGGELLFLLEKHGRKARIDIAEARKQRRETSDLESRKEE